MNSFYGKLVKNLLVSIAVINLVIISMVVIADNDFDRSLSTKSQPRFGYLNPQYLEKKYSEFLGGPGKRSDYDDYYSQSKRLSEFLGGPGKKRQSYSRNVEKRLSEFLGGPGK